MIELKTTGRHVRTWRSYCSQFRGVILAKDMKTFNHGTYLQEEKERQVEKDIYQEKQRRVRRKQQKLEFF